MKTLVERAQELSVAADRLDARSAASADASALGDALETFERQRAAFAPARERVRAMGASRLDVTLPTSGPSIAGELRALAGRIDADPTAVRDRRAEVDRVSTFVEVVANDVNAALESYVAKARGGADLGLVRTLRAIGLDDAANSVDTALTKLGEYDAKLPLTLDDLDVVDAAGERVRDVLAELKSPANEKLVDFMADVVTAPYGLERLDATLLEQLKSSGAAGNFVIRPRGQQ